MNSKGLAIGADTALHIYNIWCSVGTIYVSSDARIKKYILDVNDETALDQILIIQPKTYEYKDVINRGTKRVSAFISQHCLVHVTTTEYMLYITTNRRYYTRSSFNSKRDII